MVRKFQCDGWKVRFVETSPMEVAAARGMAASEKTYEGVKRIISWCSFGQRLVGIHWANVLRRPPVNFQRTLPKRTDQDYQ